MSIFVPLLLLAVVFLLCMWFLRRLQTMQTLVMDVEAVIAQIAVEVLHLH